MDEHDKPVLIYSTFPDAESARKAGRALIEAHLAACVNILPGMTSVYRWRGSLEESSEVVMLIKTRSALADQAIAVAKTVHPYDLPAMITLKIEAGYQPYLDWIVSETKAK